MDSVRVTSTTEEPSEVRTVACPAARRWPRNRSTPASCCSPTISCENSALMTEIVAALGDQPTTVSRAAADDGHRGLRRRPASPTPAPRPDEIRSRTSTANDSTCWQVSPSRTPTCRWTLRPLWPTSWSSWAWSIWIGIETVRLAAKRRRAVDRRDVVVPRAPTSSMRLRIEDVIQTSSCCTTCVPGGPLRRGVPRQLFGQVRTDCDHACWRSAQGELRQKRGAGVCQVSR